MTFSVTMPVTTMTRSVVTKVITITGTTTGRSLSQAVISPTAAGINITGISSIKITDASLT